MENMNWQEDLFKSNFVINDESNESPLEKKNDFFKF